MLTTGNIFHAINSKSLSADLMLHMPQTWRKLCETEYFLIVSDQKEESETEAANRLLSFTVLVHLFIIYFICFLCLKMKERSSRNAGRPGDHVFCTETLESAFPPPIIPSTEQYTPTPLRHASSPTQNQ